MSNDTLYQPKQRELVPAGDYFFAVKNVEAVPNQFAKEGQDTHQIRLTLQLEKEQGVPVMDSDGSVHTQYAFMGRILGHKQDGTAYKSQAWSEAILCQKLNSREPFDFGDLLDRKGKVRIKDLEADGVTPCNKIDVIMPLGPIVGPAYNDNKDQEKADERDLLLGYSNTKITLIEAGIKSAAIDECVARLAGNKAHFNSQPQDIQIDVLGWLAKWAGNVEEYDNTGSLLAEF